MKLSDISVMRMWSSSPRENSSLKFCEAESYQVPHLVFTRSRGWGVSKEELNCDQQKNWMSGSVFISKLLQEINRNKNTENDPLTRYR